MLTERVQRMREEILQVKPSISSERLRLVTEAYDKYAGEAIPVFRAHVFAYVLEHMTVTIREGELLVGSTNERQRCASIFPEYTGQWLLDGGLDRLPTRPNDPLQVPPEEREEILSLLESWRGRSIEELCETFLPEDVQEARRAGLISIGGRAISSGKTVPDYALMFRRGLQWYIDTCRTKINAVQEHTVENQPQVDFWNACIIACNGVIAYANRYSEEAARQAEFCEDSKRRDELLEIARICKKVPAASPDTFWEALQFMWMIYHLFYVESNPSACGFGRFDVSLGSYFDRDLEIGTMDSQLAEDLVGCLFIKTMEIIMARPDDYSRDFAGYPLWQILMLGGVGRDGKDVTNALTSLTLEVSSQLKLSQPAVALRVDDDTPEEIWRQACRMIQDGQANPAIFGDQSSIEIVQKKGGTLEDARDWIVLGCVEPHPGGGGTDGSPYGGYVNLPKCLELVMHNGIDPLTGKLLGVQTGNPADFKDMSEVVEAVKTQIRHCYDLIHKGFNQIISAHATRLPVIYASLVMEGCIESGKSVQQGGTKYTYSGIFCTGPASLADALAAVDLFVYQEKKLTLPELTEVLDRNFEGNERLRQDLLNRAPKFGNDLPEVDHYCREIIDCAAEYVQQMKDARGGNYCLCNQAQTVSVTMGYKVGATADGRLAGTPLSDNAGPAMGRDVCGPTATVNSMSRNMNQTALYDGTLMNLRFDPSGVAGEKGLAIIESVVREYVEQDGQHIQINVVDDKTLRAAQKDPENYRNILVRVAGYMAYFTELDKTVQDAIIARTAHLA